jgi:type IV pilus assembly protein PilB
MKVAGKQSPCLGMNQQHPYKIWKPVGCPVCGGSGYKSRVGIFEAIFMDQNIEKVLVQNPSEREVRDAAQTQGIPSLKEDGIIKVLEGLTSLEEIGKAVDLYGDE